MAVMPMLLGALGTVAVWPAGAGAPVRLPPTQRDLLAVLLLTDGPVPPERIVQVLRGADRPGNERAWVHVAVNRLRALLRPAIGTLVPVDRESGGYRLRLSGGATDLARFRAALAAAERAADPDDRLARLDGALALWRGTVAADARDEVRGLAAARRAERDRADAACRLADLALDRAGDRAVSIAAERPRSRPPYGAGGVLHRVAEVAAAYPGDGRLRDRRARLMAAAGERAPG